MRWDDLGSPHSGVKGVESVIYCFWKQLISHSSQQNLELLLHVPVPGLDLSPLLQEQGALQVSVFCVEPGLGAASPTPACLLSVHSGLDTELEAGCEASQARSADAGNG